MARIRLLPLLTQLQKSRLAVSRHSSERVRTMVPSVSTTIITFAQAATLVLRNMLVLQEFRLSQDLAVSEMPDSPLFCTGLFSVPVSLGLWTFTQY